MSVKPRIYVRFLAVFALLGGLGIAASIYTLVNERLGLPISDTYNVNAEFTAADAVVSGLGQPVNVVGVKVGQVVGVHLRNGVAVVTLQIQRHQVPHIYDNASAVLEPITPLKDMQINLDPGNPPAPPLRPGATIDVGETSSPVPLSDLLSTLDADTRSYLSSLIASLDQGTRARGPDIRAMLSALGPTSADVGQISRALAARRAELAHLIHNIALVTRAAAEDHQLAAVVVAGDQTLHAIADQDKSLRGAIAQLPATLSVARSTLIDLKPFAQTLGPTLTTLEPAVKRLPATFSALRAFAQVGTTALASEVRPFIKDAQPLVKQLAPAVVNLTRATPYLSVSFQVLEYVVNELAYNPGNIVNGSPDEGFLFWLAWFGHNWNSVVSSGDANGGIGRLAVLATCYGLQNLTVLQGLFGVTGLCPK